MWWLDSSWGKDHGHRREEEAITRTTITREKRNVGRERRQGGGGKRKGNGLGLGLGGLGLGLEVRVRGLGFVVCGAWCLKFSPKSSRTPFRPFSFLQYYRSLVWRRWCVSAVVCLVNLLLSQSVILLGHVGASSLW